jgi:hypothetical protein
MVADMHKHVPKATLRSASLILSAMVLASCTTYWNKPGATPQEFEATKSVCIARGYSRFPVSSQQIQISGGYTTPVQTNCASSGYGYGVNTSCTSTGGQYVPPATIAVDANNNARKADFESCLYENGWQKTAKN